MYLYLIRHGETDWNAEERAQGHADVPLNARGLAQAKQLAARVFSNGKTFHALYTSPLQRAQATAELIAGATGVELTADPRLVEVGVGEIEGLTSHEVYAKYPELTAQLRTNRQRVHWPGQEAREDFVARVSSFADDLRAHHQNSENVIVVSHGATLGLYLMLLLGLDPYLRSPFFFDNASLTLVRMREPVPQLIRLNDVCHLQ